VVGGNVVVVVVVVVVVNPAWITFQRLNVVVLPCVVSVRTYDLVLVEVFDLNLADRAMVPVVQRTVVAKPEILGLDDHVQDVACRTLARKVTTPPDALTVLVAAPAVAKARPPRQRQAPATMTHSLRFIEAPRFQRLDQRPCVARSSNHVSYKYGRSRTHSSFTRFEVATES
jgi:hypothetical protein